MQTKKMFFLSYGRVCGSNLDDFVPKMDVAQETGFIVAQATMYVAQRAIC